MPQFGVSVDESGRLPVVVRQRLAVEVKDPSTEVGQALYSEIPVQVQAAVQADPNIAQKAADAAAAISAQGVLAPYIKTVTLNDQRGRVVLPTEDLPSLVQNAANGTRFLGVSGAVYTIDRMLAFAGSGIEFNLNGATLRLSDTAQRTIDPDRIIFFGGSSVDCKVHNGYVAKRPSAENAGGGRSVQIHGVHNTVDLLKMTPGTKIDTGIGAMQGRDHVITRNDVTGAPITYSWAGVSGTLCEYNTVRDAPSNALGGVGNGGTGVYNKDCVVRFNRVINCGRIGIEDYGNTLRTLIHHNYLEGCATMGISAVGIAPVVTENLETNPGTQYGIECAGNGAQVFNNVIIWTDPSTATGLIFNQANVESGIFPEYVGVAFGGNRIVNAKVAYHFRGKLGTVSGNLGDVVDPGNTGVLNEVETVRSITLTGGSIIFTKPAKSGVGNRDGVLGVTSASVLTVTGITIGFLLGSAGSSVDTFVRPSSDLGTQISGCTFDAGGRTDTNKPFLGRLDNVKQKGCQITNNLFKGGATLKTSSFDTALSVTTPNLVMST